MTAPSPDDRLAAALREYQTALDLGLGTDRAAFLARHPDLPDLAAALDSLRPAPSSLQFPLTDFDLIREVGRGGMGVVFEAWQRSLGRSVAVKVLTRAAVLDDTARRRFLHEARVGAFIPHPNVVPVFHAGEEHGVPYFVMHFVSGASLADVVRDARTDPGRGPLPPAGSKDYFTAAARAVAAVAQALGAAHEQGVIHRDVKPANLLLDDSGKLWVTDFGLALASFSDGLTRTGDRPGTLRYMSPEQLTGPRDRLDGRTDVYSLGATLYELATLRPMFDGVDEQLLGRLVIDRPPRRPRVACPAVPADLETIILKATAINPADRYQTAHALAADLSRFAAGEPILARRPGAVRKLRRWAGRNRVAVTGAAAVAVAVVMLVQLVTWRAYRAEADARAAVERNRQLALAAVVNLGNASDDILAHAPGLQERQLSFLLKCRDEFEPFAEDEKLPATVRRDIAWVHYRIGECHVRQSRWGEAEAAFRLLCARLEPLAAAEPREWTVLRDLARAYKCVGWAVANLGRHADAREWYRKALPLADRACELRPGAATALVEATEIRTSMALTDERLSGRPGAALAACLDAAAVYEALRERYPEGHPRSYMRLAYIWGAVASEYEVLGDWDEADRAYLKAIAADDHLVAHFSSEPPNIREQSWSLRGRRGLLLVGRGRTSSGLHLLRDSVRDLEKGAERYPDIDRPLSQLVSYLSLLATVERHFGQETKARTAAKRCGEHLEALNLAHDPEAAARAWALLPDAARPPEIGKKLLASHSAALPPWLRGAVLFRLGRAAEALPEVGTDEPPLHALFLRALCLAKLGRLDDARSALAAASCRLATAPLRTPELLSLEREAVALLGLADFK